jgi:glutamate/tyrosine decarboxylase-like PLP-dependent enzyme
MTLREHGTEKFGRLIHQNKRQARALADEVARHPELELLAPVALNVVCFRYRGAVDLSETERDRINQQALVRLQESGVAVPSHAQVRGHFAIRTAFVNHRTPLSDVQLLVDAFVGCCRELSEVTLAQTG